MDLSYFDQFMNDSTHVSGKTTRSPCAPPPSPEIGFKMDQAWQPSNLEAWEPFNLDLTLNKQFETMKVDEKHVRNMSGSNDLYGKFEEAQTDFVVSMVFNRLRCFKIKC